MLAAGGNLHAAQLVQCREHLGDVLVLGTDAPARPLSGLEPGWPVEE